MVQGFLHQSFKEQGRFISVDRAIFEDDAPCLGASLTLGLVLQLETSCYCIRFICIMYLLYSTFYSPHIYTFIPNWFSPWGFIQGYVDQKIPVFISCMLRSVNQHLKL
jgi:hypothetical protein